jgi:hypothetical protein
MKSKNYPRGKVRAQISEKTELITADKLVTNSVATSKILDEAVTTAKLAPILDLTAKAVNISIEEGTPVNAVASTDIILTFTDGSVDGEYFEFGDDLYEIEVSTAITDENWVAPTIGLSTPLVHIPIEGTVVVQDSTDTTTYTEDTDYSVDYATGEVTLIGTIIAGTTNHIDYEYYDGVVETGAIPVLLRVGSVAKEDAATAFTTAEVASGTEDWGAGDNSDGTVTMSAMTSGVINNGLVTDATNAAHATFDTATSLGGINGTIGVARQILADTTNIYMAIADNTIVDENWRKLVLQSL